MPKAELKTKQTNQSVAEFLKTIEDSQQRRDCKTLASMMRSITGKRAKMWGASIVGFGSYHYKYESGREGDFFITGFSPRKQNLSIYIMPGFEPYAKTLAKLGKHKTGRSCLYVKTLEDIDVDLLQKMITDSVKVMREKYPTDLTLK